MEQKKPWYKSTTIWSIVFAAAAFLVSKFTGIQAVDIPVSPNPDFDQLKAVADQVQAAKGNVLGIISAILGSLASIVAIYNRITAKAKIAPTTQANV